MATGRHRFARADLFAYVILTLVALQLLVTWRAPVQQAGAECRIVAVQDGDSVMMECGGASVRGRLVGLDAPELQGQCPAETAAARAARAALSALVQRARTTGIRQVGYDKYGRALVIVHLDGQNAANLMIAAGHARDYAGGARAGWCDPAAP